MQEEYEEAKKSDPAIRKHARQFIEYGEAREGRGTGHQIREAVKIADVKYNKEGRRVVWIFDHSSCHAAMLEDAPEDALDASQMNVNPGGKRTIHLAFLKACESFCRRGGSTHVEWLRTT